MDNADLQARELLPLENILICDRADKDALLSRLAGMLALSRRLSGCADISGGIMEREKLMSTGVGNGLGIPHVRLKDAGDMVLGAALVREGVSGYESIDGEAVRLVVMIVGREDQHVRHLRLLSKISGAMRDAAVRAALMTASGAATLHRELLRIIRLPDND